MGWPVNAGTWDTWRQESEGKLADSVPEGREQRDLSRPGLGKGHRPIWGSGVMGAASRRLPEALSVALGVWCIEAVAVEGLNRGWPRWCGQPVEQPLLRRGGEETGVLVPSPRAAQGRGRPGGAFGWGLPGRAEETRWRPG